MNTNSEDFSNALLSLSRRLAAIEKKLGLDPIQTAPNDAKPTDAPLQSAVTKPASQPRPTLTPATDRKGAKPQFLMPDYAKPTGGFSAGSFLGAVGIICFIFAASLIVKLTIASGWLTPMRQWSILAVFGVSLIVGAMTMRKRDSQYSGLLAGGGVVVLFTASYASKLFFEIAGVEVAFVLAIATSVLCLVLHGIFQGPFFVGAAVLGTYATPVILGSHSAASLPVLSAYYILWSGLFSWISTSFASRTMQLTAACAGIGIYGLLNLDRTSPDDALFIITMQFLQFTCLLLGVIRYSIMRGEPLTSSEAWAFSPVLIFFYATEYYYLNLWNPALAPWISLGFSSAVLVLYNLTRRHLRGDLELESGPMVGAFAALSFIHAGYFELLPKDYKPFCLPLIVIVYLMTVGSGGKTRNPFLFCAAIVIALFEYLRICSILLIYKDAEPLVLLAGVLSSIALLLVLGKRSDSEGTEKDQTTILLLFTHILSILSIYRLAYDHGSLAVSAGWAVYSVAVLGWGYSKNDATLARSSLIIFLIAAAKALLYDASQAATEVRVICLILTGALLYGSGFLFRKIAAQGKS